MAKRKELLPPVHPGEILREEFMKPLGLSINQLARDLYVPVTRISEIVNERRAITAETALRLARYFGTTPEVWLNLQSYYDLEKAARSMGAGIERTVHPNSNAARVEHLRSVYSAPTTRADVLRCGSRQTSYGHLCGVCKRIESGEKRKLTSRPANSVGDSGPAFAPNGHAIAFVRTQTLASSDLYVLALSRVLTPVGEPHRLTSGGKFTSSPSWSPDGKDIIFAFGRWDGLQLWRVAETATSQPRRIEFLAGHVNDPTVSRRGQLAYSQKSTDINIWRTELSESGRKRASPGRFIASTQIDGNPQFSPDGKHIVFASDRTGSREIWVCNEDGSNTTQLTSMGAPISGSPRWSPDGSRIIFDSNAEGQFELYIVSASGGLVKRLTHSPADEAYGLWSIDGRWIYFMSSRSGQRQIWKMAETGVDAVQVTKNGGVVPYPSPDGNFLYYSERAGQGEGNGMGGLRRMRLADGQDEQVLPSVTFMNAALTREGIYFIPRADAGGHSVYFFCFQTNKTSPLLHLSGPVSEGLAVSPDGRWLLSTQIDAQISDLMLVEGFR